MVVPLKYATCMCNAATPAGGCTCGNATCEIQDVNFEDNVVGGGPAAARAVGVWQGGRVFAAPETAVWRLPQGPGVASEAVANVSSFPVRFLDAGGGFRGLESVRL